MDSQFSKSRRSLRLKEYDYRNAGAYFVTICTQDRECLFGVVESEVEGEVVLYNPAGIEVVRVWEECVAARQHLKIDEFVLMPNHFHAIVSIIDNSVGVDLRVNPKNLAHQSGQIRRSAPTEGSLSELVQRFKAYSTNKYIHGVKNHNWPHFNKRLWQRNYYERVIRNDEELNAIRQYIIDNPKNWNEDKYNPNT